MLECQEFSSLREDAIIQIIQSLLTVTKNNCYFRRSHELQQYLSSMIAGKGIVCDFAIVEKCIQDMHFLQDENDEKMELEVRNIVTESEKLKANLNLNDNNFNLKTIIISQSDMDTNTHPPLSSRNKQHSYSQSQNLKINRISNDSFANQLIGEDDHSTEFDLGHHSQSHSGEISEIVVDDRLDFESEVKVMENVAENEVIEVVMDLSGGLPRLSVGHQAQALKQSASSAIENKDGVEDTLFAIESMMKACEIENDQPPSELDEDIVQNGTPFENAIALAMRISMENVFREEKEQQKQLKTLMNSPLSSIASDHTLSLKSNNVYVDDDNESEDSIEKMFDNRYNISTVKGPKIFPVL